MKQQISTERCNKGKTILKGVEFGPAARPGGARPILAKFPNITRLLIPNCTHNRMITYTYLIPKNATPVRRL